MQTATILHATKQPFHNIARLKILLILAWLATGCTEQNTPLTIQEQGTLRIISRNGPTTYYEDRSGPTGFEYELAKLFADYLGVKLKISAQHSLEDIFEALEDNEAHIAAAGLTITKERQKRLNFSPPYLEIKQYLLYRADRVRPKSPEDILGSRITVMANSSHEEILSALELQYPDLIWRTATDVETVDLLDMLADGDIDYTILDSNEYIANRGFYPRLNIGFEIGEPGQLAWALPGKINTPGLMKELEVFFNLIKENGTLRQLKERFYSHSKQVNRIGSLTFNQAISKRFPKYEKLIKQVATEYNIDWQLLAAISYQESHWNPRAKSPTGVRGMMMLTLPTAKEMGIKNRLDAEQSLRGGVRYFNKILQRIPAGIKEPDRTWFSLAAYNVGRGHLEDARKITASRGGDPNKWADVKDNLPLLRKRRWYKNTKHGYARGNEPVTYVQNIRHYYNVLNWAELAKDRTPPPQQVEQYLPDPLKSNIRSL
ncbi:MAG: membrane-bound lytic murein transglycosylase MltF [Pseudomonadales bacterium]